MKHLILPIGKFTGMILLIGCFVLTSLLSIPLQVTFPFVAMKFLNRVVQFYSKISLRILQINVSLEGIENLSSGETYLIVCNHLSYVDILIISSVLPSSFVTSLDMKAVPILGHLTKLGGCLYVNRRSRKNISNELYEIKSALQEGINVAFFPEGTSSNHEKVLTFKRSLFESIENTSARILPLTLNYTTINHRQINLVSRDWVCWYGDMSFAPHLWSLVKCSKVKAELHVHSSFIPHSKDTKVIRDQSFAMIVQKFQPVG